MHNHNKTTSPRRHILSLLLTIRVAPKAAPTLSPLLGVVSRRTSAFISFTDIVDVNFVVVTLVGSHFSGLALRAAILASCLVFFAALNDVVTAVLADCVPISLAQVLGLGTVNPMEPPFARVVASATASTASIASASMLVSSSAASPAIASLVAKLRLVRITIPCVGSLGLLMIKRSGRIMIISTDHVTRIQVTIVPIVTVILVSFDGTVLALASTVTSTAVTAISTTPVVVAATSPLLGGSSIVSAVTVAITLL